MPAPYTHYAVAKETFARLPHNLQKTLLPHLPLYFFGSQGADFCFFYPTRTRNKMNLGRTLHRKGYEFFRILSLFSETDEKALSYALGYITHYATDTTFHPFVYYLSGKSLRKHSQVESALDGYLRHVNEHGVRHDPFSSYLRPSLKEEELDTVFLFYSAYATVNSYLPLTKPTFKKSFFAFNTYTGISLRVFGRKRLRVPISVLTNAEKKVWQNPKAPFRQSTDGADELFEKSVKRAVEYIQQFQTAVAQKKAPPKESFSKSFLSGI